MTVHGRTIKVMNVNIALHNARNAVRQIFREYGADGSDDDDIAALALELAEAFDAIDSWLQNGGALPAPWQPRTQRKAENDDDIK